MRPNNMCAMIYNIAIGFPEDEYHIIGKQLNVLIECYLKYLDLDYNYKIKPFVFQAETGLLPVFIYQVNFYNDRLFRIHRTDMKLVYLISRILQMVKAFKVFRRRNVQLNATDINETNTTIHVRRPRMYEAFQIEMIVKDLRRSKSEIVEDLGSVSACLCQLGPLLRCHLICFRDKFYQEDVDFINSDHLCIDRFQTNVEPLENAAEVSFRICFSAIYMTLILLFMMLLNNGNVRY